MIQNRHLLISILFFFSFSLFALDVPVYVQDGELLIPLEGVEVKCRYGENESIIYITDETGQTLLSLPDNAMFPVIISVSTPGYNETSIELTHESAVSASGNPLVITMGLSVVIEGEELIVQGLRPGKTDEKCGISMVRTSEDMKSTAQVGVVEDVMNSVSTLPGVGFKLGMNVEPSIRGGYPKEMGVTFDGVYLLEPYYWDGMVSILSPYMVDTVKLSTGVFSSRYGQGCSGLLDTSSVRIGDAKKITLNISTISADIAAELPLGGKNDLFLYAHVTELTAAKWIDYGILGFCDEYISSLFDPGWESMRENLLVIKEMPHIFNAYIKWTASPLSDIHFSVNGLFSHDGIRLEEKFKRDDDSREAYYAELYSKDPPYYSVYQLRYKNIQGLASINLDWLITNKTRLHSIFSYSTHTEKIDNWLYTLSAYDDFVFNRDEGTRTTVFRFGEEDKTDISTTILHQLHGKVESEVQVNDNSMFAFGIEEVAKLTNSDEYSYDKQMFSELDGDVLLPLQGPTIVSHVSVPGNSLLTSSAFALWNFGNDKTVLEGEAGLRGEHYYLWNKEAAFEIASLPVLNPRVTILYTPLSNTPIVEKLSFSAGSGLFSTVNEAVCELQKEHSSIPLKPDTAWTSVIGTRAAFQSGIHISLEAYYKHYLSRMYVYTDKREMEHVVYHTASDGKGWVFGSDVMVEKKVNDWLDGYMSYSFLYARFLNPAKAEYESQTTTTGDPLEIWYYPSYHRFHTCNYVLNFRMKKEVTLTVSGSIATGSPRKKYIDKSKEYMDGSFIDPGLNERMYLVLYSDTDRNYIDWPVDIRLSKKGLFKNNSKRSWEWYIAVENITSIPAVLIKMNKAEEEGVYFESSGWTVGKGLLKVDLGFFPIPSFGVKFIF
jgi:hypothetical protein